MKRIICYVCGSAMFYDDTYLPIHKVRRARCCSPERPRRINMTITTVPTDGIDGTKPIEV